jgi:hypothetical protein
MARIRAHIHVTARAHPNFPGDDGLESELYIYIYIENNKY